MCEKCEGESHEVEQDLFDAIRANFSPGAAVAIAMRLRGADTKSDEVNRQLVWLSGNLATLVGGPEKVLSIANEIGI